MNSPELTIKLIAMIELEDKLSENLKEFGDIEQVTISDLTRKVREDPQLLSEIRNFIKLKNEREESK